MSDYDEPFGSGRERSVQLDPPRLLGSRDSQTGDSYFPPRRYSVDGTLRELEVVELSPTGTLYAWTCLGATAFGQVDLAAGPRVQGALEGTEHEIGATYEVVVEADGDSELAWRFRRA